MPSSPAWLEWSTAAFSRAARLDRPVLLLVTTWWSEAGRTLERTTLADAGVVALVDEAFVPVRVDAERRPEIGERYTLGGWPTLMALTPLGQPLGGGTFVDATRLLPALRGLADAYRARRDDLLRGTVAPPWGPEADRPVSAAPDVVAVPSLLDEVTASYDPEHAGFGTAGKRLHAPALRVALKRLAEAPDGRLADAVTRTLRAIATRLVSGHGGVCRATAHRDWTHPERAYLLDVQAEAVHLFLDAWTVLGDERDRARALDVVEFVRVELGDASQGGFFAAAIDAEVDRTVYVDANCRMARALLHAAATLDEPLLAEEGVRAIERVVPAAYGRNAGVSHYLDPGPKGRGLLGDQVAASAALLEASVVTGSATYADLAEELIRSALRRLWNPRHGALIDHLPLAAGAGDVGWLAVPFEPLALNCEAASLLAQLGRRTGDPSLHAHAVDILRRFAPDWRAAGLDGACYALAVIDVLSEG